MSIFDQIERRDHEQVVFCSDKSSGLRAIIAVHNTTLGPALGGARMWTYASDEEALRDALRLSRGMTYKAAVAGLNLGGGKGVIIGDPKRDKTETLFRTFGRFVDGLAGRYITAEDVGTSLEDMEWVRMETKYVTGVSTIRGGSGDPSPVTALGVYVGMKACMKHATGSDSLAGKGIAIQGAGHVGQHVARHLRKEGARMLITDIYEDRVASICAETGAEGVKPDDIYDANVDIFCPCALGGVINDATIPRLKAKIIAGGANNQLAEEKKHSIMLEERKILYAPDYVINAGGLINVSNELEGYSHPHALHQAESIYGILIGVLETAKREHVPTIVASNQIAEQRIAGIGRIKHIYTGASSYSGRLGEVSRARA